MSHSDFGYGLWFAVILNSVIFILFAVSLFHPRTRRDWRAMGMYSGFIVALFVEMYGFPLTVYMLSAWLGDKVPGLNLTHNGGHLWTDLIGWKGDPHLSPFHIASYIAIGGGFWLIASAWRVLFAAQQEQTLATGGAYSYVRHPQYVGLMLIMFGFLLQWPTLPTLVLFPVMIYLYRRLAIGEEREVASELPDLWPPYAVITPRFVPRRDGHGSRSVDAPPMAETKLFNGRKT